MAAPAAALILPAGVLPGELFILLLVLLESARLTVCSRLFFRLGDMVLVPLAVIIGYLTLFALF